MRTSKLLLIFTISFLLFTQCKKEEKLSPEKELLSFSLEQEVNEALTRTILAEIVDQEIKLAIPDSIDSKSLVATFQFKGKSIYVGSVVQKSGETPNDFTQPLTYRIVAEDGGEIFYTVKVDWIFSADKELLNFSIEKELNEALSESIVAEIVEQEIKLSIPDNIDATSLIATFQFKGKSIYVGDIEQVSGETPNDFTEPLIYKVVAADGSEITYDVEVTWIENGFVDNTAMPHLYITMEADVADINKVDYITGTLRIDGKDDFENFEGTMGIRGRGNTSWIYFPKKPYRIKLDSKASLLGLPAAKDWVLLADYIEGSMLYNSIPFEMGKILEMPYTNTVMPVNLTINGEFRGVYTFTEHKEVAEGRIDIGANGVLLELDNAMDEDWTFESSSYKLPVMIQHPKSKNMNQEKLDEIQSHFEEFETLVFAETFPNNDYLDYFDDKAFVDYLIVYELTLNTEINMPRSTYINKLEGGKYRMGIIWDFDSGFGYSLSGSRYAHFLPEFTTRSLFDIQDTNRPGRVFFMRLLEDPHLKSLFKERWQWFRANGFEQVKNNVRWWSERISQAVPYDHEIWGPRGSLQDTEEDLQRVLNWLDARASYMDDYVSNF